MKLASTLSARRFFVRWLLSACVAVSLALSTGAAAQATVRLLAFGDSLVHGYGLPAGVTFP